MTSTAQVEANRANAQKSTGPRTAEGKAVVAQNAVKHGLLAREAVLRGEDREEYEEHREALLEELNPSGTLEVLLATRIVDLTWRLQRAAQSQNETFGALYDRHTAGLRPGEAGLCPGEAGAPEPDEVEPAQRGAILGRMLLEDYSGSGVLERLLRCERRIEGSLFRSLRELRRVHDQQCKVDAETAGILARPSRGVRTGWRDEDDEARKARAFASWRPNEMCEKNPIGPKANMSQVFGGTAVRSDLTCEGLRKTNPMGSAPPDTGILPVCLNHGQDAHATGGQDAHATNPPEGGTPNGEGNQSCETNPIGAEPNVSQVLYGTAVRSVSAPEGLRKTNPIGSVPSGTSIPPASPNHRRDAQATRPPGGETPNGEGNQACERKPMCDGMSLRKELAV